MGVNNRKASRVDFVISSQPDNTTCGPTCLHAIYHFYNDPIPLEQVIAEVDVLEDGGTLGVFLACHALKRGYQAKIYTYNLQVFDPTWFRGDSTLLRSRLKRQADKRKKRKIALASRAYTEFLELGGELVLEDLTKDLIRRYLKHNIPILTGLSSTYLYRSMRERGANCDDDDIRGEPQGHFVVLCHYDGDGRRVRVADPLLPNDYAGNEQYYDVSIDRIIGSILLGILTHDANFLVIEPSKAKKVAG